MSAIHDHDRVHPFPGRPTGADRLLILTRVAEKLVRASSPEGGLEEALSALVESGWFRAGAAFLHESDGRLEPATRVGVAGEASRAWESLATRPWLRGVAEDGEPLVMRPDRATEDPRVAQVFERARVGALLAVPLTTGVGCLGALVLGTAEPKPSSDWVAFARLLGVHVGQHFAIARSVAKAAALEEELAQQTQKDSLTGLPNQLVFAGRFMEVIEEAERERRIVAVVFLDLDRFRTINNALTHALGDKLLQQVAHRLVARAGHSNVYRMAGDEFVILFPGMAGEEEVAERADTVRHALEEPFEIEGNELYTTASIGVALFPYDGEDIPTLVKNADSAMFRAKEQGGNMVEFYAPALFERASRRLSLEARLHRALERDEISVHYQPLVDIRTGAVVGVEALARWQHPDLGLVLPGKFIWLAEETGLVIPIGERVLAECCAQAAVWRREGFPAFRVHANLAARQFHQSDLVSIVERTLKQAGLAPQFLGLEITESVAMRYPARTVSVLRDLKSMGIHTSLDDFGTGYSSLDYLRRFAIDSLKLDRAFVKGLATDANDVAIARAVIALAHSLGMTVVAEGVETPEQLEFLAAEGCDEMQGFLFSRPMPGPELGALLAALPAS